MKICWDNLDKLEFTDSESVKFNGKYLYILECNYCGDIFLGYKNGKFCNDDCVSKGMSGKDNPFYGKHHKEETRKRLSNINKELYKNPYNHPRYGKKHTEETKKLIGKKSEGRIHSEETKEKIREKNSGNNNYRWKNNITESKLCWYDTYANKISYAEEIRRCSKDINILEVKCTYCGKWFKPTYTQVGCRIEGLEGRGRATDKTEYRLYCSDSCKIQCPIYRKKKYVDGYAPTTSREVQPELRQMVFLRDNYTCQKCNIKGGSLHCHHIDPVANNPIESADIDNCITLCRGCHKKVHKMNGYKYCKEEK